MTGKKNEKQIWNLRKKIEEGYLRERSRREDWGKKKYNGKQKILYEGQGLYGH